MGFLFFFTKTLRKENRLKRTDLLDPGLLQVLDRKTKKNGRLERICRFKFKWWTVGDSNPGPWD